MPGFTVTGKDIIELNGDEELIRHLNSAEESFVLFKRSYDPNGNNLSEFGLRIIPDQKQVFYFQVNRSLPTPVDLINIFINAGIPKENIADIGWAKNREQFDPISGAFNKQSYNVNYVFETLVKSPSELEAMMTKARELMTRIMSQRDLSVFKPASGVVADAPSGQFGVKPPSIIPGGRT